MIQAEYDKFQEYVLEIGRRMVMCGSEVRRVEDTIIRICVSVMHTTLKSVRYTPLQL